MRKTCWICHVLFTHKFTIHVRNSFLKSHGFGLNILGNLCAKYLNYKLMFWRGKWELNHVLNLANSMGREVVFGEPWLRAFRLLCWCWSSTSQPPKGPLQGVFMSGQLKHPRIREESGDNPLGIQMLGRTKARLVSSFMVLYLFRFQINLCWMWNFGWLLRCVWGPIDARVGSFIWVNFDYF